MALGQNNWPKHLQEDSGKACWNSWRQELIGGSPLLSARSGGSKIGLEPYVGITSKDYPQWSTELYNHSPKLPQPPAIAPQAGAQVCTDTLRNCKLFPKIGCYLPPCHSSEYPTFLTSSPGLVSICLFPQSCRFSECKVAFPHGYELNSPVDIVELLEHCICVKHCTFDFSILIILIFWVIQSFSHHYRYLRWVLKRKELFLAPSFMVLVQDWL